MKKFFEEFKAFALRGNVVDLAVGIIIGGAFTAIVTSFTANFIQPILDLATGARKSFFTWGEIAGYLSSFGSAIVNFIIIAFVLFLMIKGINALMKAGEKKKAEEAANAPPTTKVCPFCKSEIAIDAVRCAHCTSELQ